jgi:hypothetical protein
MAMTTSNSTSVKPRRERVSDACLWKIDIESVPQ